MSIRGLGNELTIQKGIDQSKGTSAIADKPDSLPRKPCIPNATLDTLMNALTLTETEMQ